MRAESGSDRFLRGWGATVALGGALIVVFVVLQPIGGRLAAYLEANPANSTVVAIVLILVQLAFISTSLLTEPRTRHVQETLRQGGGDWSQAFVLLLDYLMTGTVFGIYWYASSEPSIQIAYSAQMRLWGFWAIAVVIAMGAYLWWRRRAVLTGAST